MAIPAELNRDAPTPGKMFFQSRRDPGFEKTFSNLGAFS
jgi:hypothetical protein